MASQFFDFLDEEPVMTIVTNDGKSHSVEEHFLKQNPTLRDLAFDVFEEVENPVFDVRILPDDNVLSLYLSSTIFKVIEKWSNYYYNTNGGGSFKKLLGISEVEDDTTNIDKSSEKKWYEASEWESTILDHMIKMGQKENQQFELFSKVLLVSDYLGNFKLCHAMVDRFIIYCSKNGILKDTKNLIDTFKIPEFYEEPKRRTLYKLYSYEDT